MSLPFCTTAYIIAFHKIPEYFAITNLILVYIDGEMANVNDAL